MKNRNLDFRIVDPNFKINVIKKAHSLTFFYPGTSYNISSPYLVTLPPGNYQIECWGSQAKIQEYGAYTSGELSIDKAISLYLYLGSYAPGTRSSYSYSYNGGGAGDYTGGGATDIRLLGGNWDDFISLKSRLMVAAGSGGPDTDGNGGFGGKLEGKNATTQQPGKGGTQTSGGKGFINGAFGKGGSFLVTSASNDYASGGGGGYYGGGSGQDELCCGGGGGSSFISGAPGCNAINESSTEDSIIHTNQPFHYSGIYFTNTKMIQGGEEMPLPNGSNDIGYLGSGAVRISSKNRLPYFMCSVKEKFVSYPQIFLFILITSRS